MIRDFSRGDKVVIESDAVTRFEDLEVTTFRGMGAVKASGTIVAFRGMNEDDIDSAMFEFIF